MAERSKNKTVTRSTVSLVPKSASESQHLEKNRPKLGRRKTTSILHQKNKVWNSELTVSYLNNELSSSRNSSFSRSLNIDDSKAKQLSGEAALSAFLLKYLHPDCGLDSSVNSQKSKVTSDWIVLKYGSFIWAELSAHISSIDTDSMYFHKKPGTERGSELLKALIQEEYDRKNRLPQTVTTVTIVNSFKENIKEAVLDNSQNNVQSLASPTNQENSEGLTQTFTEESHNYQPDSEYVGTASHAWNKVKIDVQEKHLERVRSEASGSGWKLISNTATYLTDTDKTRQLLYERYLEKPNDWVNGLKLYDQYKYVFENHNESTKTSSIKQQRRNKQNRGLQNNN